MWERMAAEISASRWDFAASRCKEWETARLWRFEPMMLNWAEEMAAATKASRREGAAAEKGPTSLTKTGTESLKERRDLWAEERGEIERDFLRGVGREVKESLPASGSSRYWLRRKASRPRVGVDEKEGIEKEMMEKRMRRRDGEEIGVSGIFLRGGKEEEEAGEDEEVWGCQVLGFFSVGRRHGLMKEEERSRKG